MAATIVVLFAVGAALLVYGQSRSPPKRKPAIDVETTASEPNPHFKIPDPAPAVHEGTAMGALGGRDPFDVIDLSPPGPPAGCPTTLRPR